MGWPYRRSFAMLSCKKWLLTAHPCTLKTERRPRTCYCFYNIMATSIILSFTFLLIGTGLRYLIGRRRFVRRNYAGLETFRSYTRFLLITCLERGGMFIGRLLE